MKSIFADDIIHINSLNSTYSKNNSTYPVLTSEEYDEIMAAVTPVIELVNNGLFSDAVKSIKAKKDKLALLPEILKRLYEVNCEQNNSRGDSNDHISAERLDHISLPRKGELSNSSYRAAKSNLICFNAVAAAYEDTQVLENIISPAFNSPSSSIIKEFDTLHLNKTNFQLMKVIYFREYSYPLYFNTFITYLYCTFSSMYKTKMVIFEQPGSKINFKRYDDSFNISFEPPKDNCCLQDSDKLVVFNPDREVLERLCCNCEGCEILIVYDKTGLDKDMISGSRVHKFNLAKSRSDIEIFNLEPSKTISSFIEGTALNLSEIEKYRYITNDSIRKKLYKKRFIDPFLQALE